VSVVSGPVANRLSWLGFEFGLFRYDPWEWVVLTGNRLLVGLLELVVLAVAFSLLVSSGLVPLRAETPILFLLFALIAANFTLIAIVTSLSQFVLGRRLESPGDVRGKMDGALEYRKEVAKTIEQQILPVKPDAFYLTLYHNIQTKLDEIERHTTDSRTKRAREEIRLLTEGLKPHTEYVVDLLEQPSSGLKHALFTSLSADFETQMHRAWHLQAEHAAEFAGPITDPLARLTAMLEHIEVASRMFKTVFIESEVAELSRFLLYVGLPVQFMAVGVMLLYTTPGSVPLLSATTLRVLIPTVLTLGFAPFLLLASYVVRLTVVARRTADIFPFSSQLESTVAVREEF